MFSCLLVISYLLLLWYHSPFQALTAFTLPRYLLLRPAGIACGFLTFSFSGVGLLAQPPTWRTWRPNHPETVDQLYPWTLGSSGTSGSPFPVPTYVDPLRE
jgi:hypothetical protein